MSANLKIVYRTTGYREIINLGYHITASEAENKADGLLKDRFGDIFSYAYDSFTFPPDHEIRIAYLILD
jgi:hypothetical protein